MTPDNPLNYTGPEFLHFYAVLFAVALLVSLVIRQFLRPAGRPEAHDPGALPVTDAALLCRGPEAAFETAVLVLSRSGFAAREPGTTKITFAGKRGDLRDPLLDATVGVIEGGGDPIEWRRRARLQLERSALALKERGWLMFEEQRTWHAVLTLLPLLVLAFVGVAKLITGLSRDRPVGFLCLWLLVTAGVIALMGWKHPRLTRAGERIARALRDAPATCRRATLPGLEPHHASLSEFAVLGTLGGTLIAEGTTLTLLREKPLRKSDPGSGSGGCTTYAGSGCTGGDSGGSFSGGGDSGGGDSGGGGGGGCGGCGGGGCGGS